MKIQNLAIIFLVIIIPILMLLTFYINNRSDTLETQESFNSKIITATKDAIKAFEINSSDWESTISNQERNASTMVNTFISSLANQLGRTGITKEYMEGYIPAILVNMYDGYYVYSPNYVPVKKEDPDGLQLFLHIDPNNSAKTISTVPSENILYEAANGGDTGTYEYTDANGIVITATISGYTTDITKAKMVYKHYLSNKMAYAARYTGSSTQFQNAVVNFTLDNRIYVYINIPDSEGNEKAISRDGYLVYFDEAKTVLPNIKITSDNDIVYGNKINETVYAYMYEDETGAKKTNENSIQSEILTEQIVYTDDDTNFELGTFKYVYDIQHEKLYYDEKKADTDNTIGVFFTLDTNKKRVYLYADDSQVRYKSVSVLLGDCNNNTTSYKKIYQALSGSKKGRWYINSKTDHDENMEYVEESVSLTRRLNKEIRDLSKIGLNNKVGFAAIYRDFSAISYYVESYAFTNWVRQNLGTITKQQYIKYNLANGDYEIATATTTTIEEGDQIFNVSYDNNPEDKYSPFATHKRRMMQELIMESLNLAISNYNFGGKFDFNIPQITYVDWEHLFENVSMLTFVQGIPIGLKDYNNYTIATSKFNREYVNPKGIYLSGEDQNYHYPFCNKVQNVQYTGYRSVEYILKNFTNESKGVKDLLYYEHDEKNNNKSELACYYCLVNSENYEQLKDDGTDPDIQTKIYYQTKAYTEALARERYSQKERVDRKLDLSISNMDIIFILDASGSMTFENPNTGLIKGDKLLDVYEDVLEAIVKNSTNFYLNTIFFQGTQLEENTSSTGAVINDNCNEIGELDPSNLSSYITDLETKYNPSGGTFYSIAFMLAKEIVDRDLATSPRRKVIIFMTDGGPTVDVNGMGDTNMGPIKVYWDRGSGTNIEDEGYLKYAEDLKGNNSGITTQIYAINFYDPDTDVGVTPSDANNALKDITGDQDKVFQADSNDLLEAFAEAIMAAK